MTQVRLIVGIDVAKAFHEVCLPGEEVMRIANDPAGHRSLVRRLARLEGEVVVGLEATGGYERELLDALVVAGGESAAHKPPRKCGFKAAELRTIFAIVEQNADRIIEAWHDHFGD